MTAPFQPTGKWWRGRRTATGNTAYSFVIPPRSPLEITHITDLTMTTSSTAHSFYFMRPLNWTTVSVTAAAAQATITLTADPGIYSTNYQYPLGPGANLLPNTASPPARAFSVADTGIAATHYVAYQCADGTWISDIVSSVSAGPPIVLTMTTNIPTATLLAGSKIYTFGLFSLKDPATGQVAEFINTTNYLSQVYTQYMYESYGDDFAALHPGDPLLFYDANTTGQDFVEKIGGYYAAW